MTWTVWSVSATCWSDLVRQLLKTGRKLHRNLSSRAWCLLWSESHSTWLAAHILEVCGHFFSFNMNLRAVWLDCVVGVINDEDGHCEFHTEKHVFTQNRNCIKNIKIPSCAIRIWVNLSACSVCECVGGVYLSWKGEPDHLQSEMLLLGKDM